MSPSCGAIPREPGPFPEAVTAPEPPTGDGSFILSSAGGSPVFQSPPWGPHTVSERTLHKAPRFMG